MGRGSKGSRRSVSRIVLWGTPLLVALVLGIIVYFGLYNGIYNGGQPSYAINTNTSLGLVVNDRFGGVRWVIPDKPIGIPGVGGFMQTTQYLSDGVNGNYPLFTTPSLCGNTTGTGDYCLIRMLSTVDRSYTLGDFFNVWGLPLGSHETLSPSFPTNSTETWAMCLSSGGNPWVPSSDWGSHVLSNGEVILLAYSSYSQPPC